MKTSLRVLLITSIAAIALWTSSATAQDRTVAEILDNIKKIEHPKFDPSKREDEDYIKKYREAMEKADKQEATLILELYKAHPDDAKTQELLPKRWAILMDDSESASAVNDEMDAVIKKAPDSKLAGEAQFMRAQTAVQKAVYTEKPEPDKAMLAVDAFIKAAPKDERAARLLGMVADAYEDGSKEQLAAYQRIIDTYPKSGAAKYAPGKIHQASSIGKPFELSFQNAIYGVTVDMKDLRGQVVVIDFWATWCGPCVGEMPKMKELYAKYHDQGVQFIGVSLDQPEDKGGLEKLKKFVKEKEIAWPQYYQGNGWECEISKSWGINAILAMLVVD